VLSPNAILQGRYRVEHTIGQDGPVLFYRAVDERLHFPTVIKEYPTASPETTAAAEREVQLLAELDHRALPSVRDKFSEQGSEFLVLSVPPGQALLSLLTEAKERPPIPTLLNWAAQLLDLLDYLHMRRPGVYLNEISAADLFVTNTGDIMLLGLTNGTPAPNALADLKESPELEKAAKHDVSIMATLIFGLLSNQDPQSLAGSRRQGDKFPESALQAPTLYHGVPKSVSLELLRAMAPETVEPGPTAAQIRGELIAAVKQSVEADTLVDVPIPSHVSLPEEEEFPTVIVHMPTPQAGQGMRSPATDGGEKICPNCRRSFAAEKKFCSRDGTMLVARQSTPVRETVLSQAPPPPRVREETLPSAEILATPPMQPAAPPAYGYNAEPPAEKPAAAAQPPERLIRPALILAAGGAVVSFPLSILSGLGILLWRSATASPVGGGAGAGWALLMLAPFVFLAISIACVLFIIFKRK
jgi:hypothetical protein